MKLLLSYAFRPFFLLAGLFALLGIAGFLLMAVATWTQRPAWPCCANSGSPPRLGAVLPGGAGHGV